MIKAKQFFTDKKNFLVTALVVSLALLTACSQSDANTRQTTTQEDTLSSSLAHSVSDESERGDHFETKSDPAFEDRERKSRIQSEHRQLVSAVQSYFADQLVDDQASVINSLDSIDILKPYLAIEESEIPSDVLAKNPDGSLAHTLQDGVLTSTWRSSISEEEDSWTYHIDPNVAP